MSEALLLDAGIIVPLQTKASLQICEMKPGEYCISAYEESTDATAWKTILIRLDKKQLEHLINVFRCVRDKKSA